MEAFIEVSDRYLAKVRLCVVSARPADEGNLTAIMVNSDGLASINGGKSLRYTDNPRNTVLRHKRIKRDDQFHHSPAQFKRDKPRHRHFNIRTPQPFAIVFIIPP